MVFLNNQQIGDRFFIRSLRHWKNCPWLSLKNTYGICEKLRLSFQIRALNGFVSVLICFDARPALNLLRQLEILLFKFQFEVVFVKIAQGQEWGNNECVQSMGLWWMPLLMFLKTTSQLEDYNLVRSRNSYFANYIHTSIHASIGNTS